MSFIQDFHVIILCFLLNSTFFPDIQNFRRPVGQGWKHSIERLDLTLLPNLKITNILRVVLKSVFENHHEVRFFRGGSEAEGDFVPTANEGFSERKKRWHFGMGSNEADRFYGTA